MYGACGDDSSGARETETDRGKGKQRQRPTAEERHCGEIIKERHSRDTPKKPKRMTRWEAEGRNTYTDDGDGRTEGKGRIHGRRGRTEKKEGRDWEVGRKDGCFGRRRKTLIRTEVREDGRKEGSKEGREFDTSSE